MISSSLVFHVDGHEHESSRERSHSAEGRKRVAGLEACVPLARGQREDSHGFLIRRRRIPASSISGIPREMLRLLAVVPRPTTRKTNTERRIRAYGKPWIRVDAGWVPWETRCVTLEELLAENTTFRSWLPDDSLLSDFAREYFATHYRAI